MNKLAAQALEIVQKHATTTANNVQNISPRQNIAYSELAHYIRVLDLKGVVDIFGDVRGDKSAAHKLAEYCIARWDMTPEIYEYVQQYLISPLRYPVVYNKPEKNHIYADDFDNDWQFKRYCELVELKIKTKPGWIMKAPYVDAPLKLAGINAFMYAGRYKNAKFASPLKMHQSSDVFDRISYHFHTHNVEIMQMFPGYKFDARSIKYLDNHFEICNEGEACSINRVVRVISIANSEFTVPLTIKSKFEQITGRVQVAQSALKTITNAPKVPNTQPRGNSRRGKKQRMRLVIAEDA
ncbi:hypothetical protein D5b_00196 [Faustovirus]|nr:hypothetical protein D5b_00196 [Faustovirus]AMN84717.1 hypothetical protein D6_00315 [Faustovirus]AMP44150.1 hypothetical protein PRJ_Dakar_00194 [Faustovirus]QKE50402.1 hypothetical protein F-VV10_0282 [Faustovirus]